MVAVRHIKQTPTSRILDTRPDCKIHTVCAPCTRFVCAVPFCSAALPPGVYSTTSSGVYRTHLRPAFSRVARLPAFAARRNQTGHRTSNGAPAAAYKLEEPRHDFRALPWRIAFVCFRRLFHGFPDSFHPYSRLLTTGHLLKIVL